jgi:hypothetical protein
VVIILLAPGKEQVANAGRQKWDYCAPKVNYADVRARVANAFAEKANEPADAIAVVQGLSKDTSRSLVAAAVLFVYVAPCADKRMEHNSNKSCIITYTPDKQVLCSAGAKRGDLI